MKRLTILIFLIAVIQNTTAQNPNDFLLSGAVDVIRTDITKPFDKVQVGLEVNYFIKTGFAVGAGAELRSQQREAFAIGVRWYPRENIFLRFRTLFGANDVSIGAGWVFPIDRNFRFEALGDLYFERPDFALRGGISYAINYWTRK